MGAEARPAAVVLTFRDVSERRDYEAELHRLAEVDELTGVPNRRTFLAALGSPRLAPARGLARRAAGARPGPLQGAQRHARARGRGPAAGARRPGHGGAPALQRLPRPPGGRRVRRPAAARGRGRGRARGARAAERLREEALPTARDPPDEREHRRGPALRRRRRERRPGAPVRRRRDVRGQGAGRDRWELAHSTAPGRATARSRSAWSWPSAPARWRWPTRSARGWTACRRARDRGGDRRRAAPRVRLPHVRGHPGARGRAGARARGARIALHRPGHARMEPAHRGRHDRPLPARAGAAAGQRRPHLVPTTSRRRRPRTSGPSSLPR